MFKNTIVKLLEWQTKRFLKKHKPKLIAVAGSVGKTSTRFAIGTVLSRHYRVSVNPENYNMEVSVPLTIMEVPLPLEVRSATAWLKTLWQAEQKIRQSAISYEVIVVELGTDKPGDLRRFGTYLRPDIGVITAVTPEHMEFFKTIDAVAQEELTVANFSDLALINRDDIDALFVQYLTNTNLDTYGTSGVAEYHFLIEDVTPGKGFSGKFVSPEFGEQPVTIQLVGEHNVKSAVAAGAVGIKLGMPIKEVVAGLELIRPVPGRMQILKGLLDSTLIDDTYNSSPAAAVAALQTLYVTPGTQKIAILGSMNELGDFSKAGHEQVSKACDAAMLDWVVTIGDEAQTYLAPMAASNGCQVRSFKSPYDAGAFVHSVLQQGAVVLAKGSQNGVFAEEALKLLLHNPEEESQLVRQSPYWLTVKAKQFEKFRTPVED